jgi:predicted TIM-barrel fold metal-dependent hydrolase
VLVDTHVHVVSDDDAEFPLQPSDLTDAWYRDAPCTADGLVTLMDGAGVDAAVLVQAVSAYGYDNRYCAQSAQRSPGRFTSVGCVDVTAGDAIAAAGRIVHDLGMRGVRWFVVRGGSISEPRALWRELADLGVPVVVTTLADRLPELAETLPGLEGIPIALDHCGFADLSYGVPDALAALAAFPNVVLKVSSITLEGMTEHGDPAEGVAELAACFAGRLMWGSDYSQTHDRPYADLDLGGNAVRMWPELAG